MKKRTIFLSFIAFGLASSHAAASTFENGVAGNHLVAITGVVPVICQVRAENAVIEPMLETVPLGTIKETCNNPNGYRLVVNYSPTLAGTTLLIDDRKIALGNSGSATVMQVNGPARAERLAKLVLASAHQTGNLTFRIEPR